MTDKREIRVRVRFIDGPGKSRKFATLAGAKKFAHEYVGATPDVGTSYAVGFCGDVTVSVEGATLKELFPGSYAGEERETREEVREARALREADGYYYDMADDEDDGDSHEPRPYTPPKAGPGLLPAFDPNDPTVPF